MEIHLTYALVITRYESKLIPRKWDIIAAQDFTVTALYNADTREMLYLNDYQHADCDTIVDAIVKAFALSGITPIVDKRIIIVKDVNNL